MVASATCYCLADMAADHFWAVDCFIPVRYYEEACDEIPHFATRHDAEVVARGMRNRYDCHLRVMVMRPGQRPKALRRPVTVPCRRTGDSR